MPGKISYVITWDNCPSLIESQPGASEQFAQLYHQYCQNIALGESPVQVISKIAHGASALYRDKQINCTVEQKLDLVKCWIKQDGNGTGRFALMLPLERMESFISIARNNLELLSAGSL